MQKLPLTIEVVRSTNKDFSSLSEASANEIVAVLARHYEHVVMTNIDSPSDIDELVDRHPDIVFAGIYFVTDPTRNDAKVWLADELEKHGIAHTGSGKNANRLSINKHLAKQRLIEQGINTAAFALMRRDSDTPIHEGSLRFPLFVKPSDKSGGQGVDDFSIVHTTTQLQKKVHEIHTDLAADALVEEYLSGREFSVAIIGGPANTLTAMPLELVAAKNDEGERIRSRAVRSIDNEALIEVANLDERARIGNFAIDAFRAIGSAGYGRVDIRYNALGEPFFLEVNHIPSLIAYNSSFLMAYQFTIGGTYETMILHIVALALQHKKAASEEILLPSDGTTL